MIVSFLFDKMAAKIVKFTIVYFLLSLQIDFMIFKEKFESRKQTESEKE